jgi:pyrroloquinoline quinone biosynthesis protein B
MLVLGSAAGGGFPEAARRARAGQLAMRTQSSVAVSADERRWVLLNASPDLRQQINERRWLQPAASAGRRASPIAAVVLTSVDIDHVAGLLTLRERQPLALYDRRCALNDGTGSPSSTLMSSQLTTPRLRLPTPQNSSSHSHRPWRWVDP